MRKFISIIIIVLLLTMIQVFPEGNQKKKDLILSISCLSVGLVLSGLSYSCHNKGNDLYDEYKLSINDEDLHSAQWDEIQDYDKKRDTFLYASIALSTLAWVYHGNECNMV